MFAKKIILPVLVAFLYLLPSAALGAESACCTAVDVGEAGIGRDDLGGAGLAEAIGASLGYLRRQPDSRTYRLCDREYGAAALAAGLADFLAFSAKEFGSGEFGKRFRDRFEMCAANTAEGDGQVLVTGYFEPLLEGSLTREPPFVYPLYAKPDDLIRRDGRLGRLRDNSLVPYWTRAEIENEGVLRGNELVYLDDPVEAFILHVQGSGRIRLRDGRVRRIQFAAKNGLPYRSIGKLLVDRGELELAAVSLPAIVAYLDSHPRERDDILQYNQSYIFFRWGNDAEGGPLGSLGVPLTAGRSVALDRNCFPPGALAFLQTRKPIFNDEDEIIGWAPLRRFVVNQDSGSAIEGSGRVDLFLGGGKRARETAGRLKHPGKLYFPVAKNIVVN
ncbi:MAG: MltA domain-containing protein [Desulfurivibrionaceae bacterium]|nr:MltA domain-containing protein [Desulfurivibrionaceae bacterium]